MRKIRLKKQKKTIDRKLFIIAIVLTTLGLIAIADASAPQALNTFSDKFYFVKQQLTWGFFGFIVLILATRIHYSFWGKIATLLLGASVVLLALALTPWAGVANLGAKRWVLFLIQTPVHPQSMQLQL